MKISKKLLGAAMSLVLVGSQAMPVLAASSSTEPTAGTGQGTANILDYKVETVVVPTALKIVLNPKGYTITTKYEKATSYAANTVYYTESGGTYTKTTVADATAFGNGGPYYTAVTSTSQIVSLNYGIANKSTADKDVSISFAATYTADTTKKAIQFVDSEEKAQAYDETSNDEGAKSGEHKIYLAVASASALPTANTYIKTTDTTATTDGSKTYYTKSGTTYTKVASPTDAGLATYYEATTTIGTEITAAELSDVTMTAATAGVQAFAAGTTDKANASIAYKLEKATYNLKDGEIIDFDTEQGDLSTKLEMSAIGGVAGFTLTGAVNADADWTKADTAAITITPTYTITDATGTETAVASTYKQVTLTPALTTTAYEIDASNSPIIVPVSNLGNETIDSVIKTEGNVDLVARGFATVSGANVTIGSNYLSGFGAGVVATIKITTSGGTELTLTVTKPAAGG